MAKIPTHERLLAEIWVPIDIDVLAGRFRCDADLVFGRLAPLLF